MLGYEDKGIRETDVLWIVKILYENSELVSNRDKFALALGLSYSLVTDINRTINMKLSDTQDFFKMVLCDWISYHRENANFGTLMKVLEDEDFHPAAVKIQSILEDPNQYPPEDSCCLDPNSSIWFEIPDKVYMFTGRDEELKELHNLLSQQNSTADAESNILSTLISGLGGIGKTSLTVRYAWTHFPNVYQHVVWINAENTQTMSDSFSRLARVPKLGLANHNFLTLKEIVSEIFEKLSTANTLIIFDNMESSENVEPFLPVRTPTMAHRPFVLLTTRNRRSWSLRTNSIDLQVFKEADSIGFLKSFLHLERETELEYAKSICTMLQNLPLGIRQAGAYIKIQREKYQSTEVAELMKSYINDFQTNSAAFLKFQHWRETADKYEKTVFTTWSITMEKLRRLNPYTLRIIQLIAYFNPDNIPIQLIRQIGSLHENVDAAIQLLVDFSLVSKSRTQNLISVHRLLQKVVRDGIEVKMDRSVLKTAIQLITKPLKSNFHNDYGQLCLSHAIAVCTYLPSITEKLYSDLLTLIALKQNNLIEIQVKLLVHLISTEKFESKFVESKKLYTVQTGSSSSRHLNIPLDELFVLRFAKVACDEIVRLWESGDLSTGKGIKSCGKILKGFGLTANAVVSEKDSKDFEKAADSMKTLADWTSDLDMKQDLLNLGNSMYRTLFNYSRERNNAKNICKLYQNMLDCSVDDPVGLNSLMEGLGQIIIDWSDNQGQRTQWKKADLEFLGFCKLYFKNWSDQTPEELLYIALAQNLKIYEHFNSKHQFHYAFQSGVDAIFFLGRLNRLHEIMEILKELRTVLVIWLQKSSSIPTCINICAVPAAILKWSDHPNCQSIRTQMVSSALDMYAMISRSSLENQEFHIHQYFSCISGMVKDYTELNRFFELVEIVREFKSWIHGLISTSKPRWSYFIRISQIVGVIWTCAVESSQKYGAAVHSGLFQQAVSIFRMIFEHVEQKNQSKSKEFKFLNIVVDLAALSNLYTTNDLLSLILDFANFIIARDLRELGDGDSSLLYRFACELSKLGRKRGETDFVAKAYIIYNLLGKLQLRKAILKCRKSSELFKCLVDMGNIQELLQLIDHYKMAIGSQYVEIAESILEISENPNCLLAREELLHAALYIFKKNRDSPELSIDIYSKTMDGIIRSLTALNKTQEIILTINGIRPSMIARKFETQAILAKAECLYNCDRDIANQMLPFALASYREALAAILANTTSWNSAFYQTCISIASQGIANCLRDLSHLGEICDNFQEPQMIVK